MLKKRPIIIDTDPGIDDALAIAIALFSGELDVRLVTTVAGNVSIEKVTRNILRLLSFFGKDVPVAMGARKPLIGPLVDAADIHGPSGMEGFDFPEPREDLLLQENAVNAMRRVIMDSDEPMTLVPIGPLTNVALLLSMYPEVGSHIREIVMMGGSITRGNKGVMSEFNIATDPEAAKIVFDSGIPIVVATQDVGLKALVIPEDTQKLPELGQVGQMAHCLFRKYRGGSFNMGLKMYDSCAIAYLLAPALFETVDTFVDVELAGSLTKGCTVVDLENYLKQPANAKVCVDIDGEAFRRWFLESVAKCI